MKLERCYHCRQGMVSPGGKPRLGHEWSDWVRLCEACLWAEHYAAYLATARTKRRDVWSEEPETSYDEYWLTFDEALQEDHYGALRRKEEGRMAEYAIRALRKIEALPTVDVVPPSKVWSWNR